jgi:eukaryotic-like serine/threonine-protein kinase
MHDGAGDPPQPEGEAPPARDRLDSWKEIAAYMRRGVTTVQRWEQGEGLPVHRLPHASRGSVFALRHELDAWRSARAGLLAGRPAADGSASARPAPDPSPTTEVTPTTSLPATRSAPPRVDGGRASRVASVATMTVVGGALIAGVLAFAMRDARPPDRPGDRDARAAGSSPRPLANDPDGELDPSLSPDGTWVVYGRERAGEGIGVYVKPVAGGPPRRVPVGPGVRFEESPHPAWSPRGETIAFLAYEAPQTYGLFLVSSDGGEARRLTSMAGIGLCWHPSGDAIGFVDRLSTGEPFSVFLLSLETGQRRRLTAPPIGAFGDTHCAFSPDGGRLAVVRYDTRYASDVFVVDDLAAPAASTAPTAMRAGWIDGAYRLTRDLPGLNGIAWTPDAPSSSVVVGSHRGLWRVQVPARTAASGPAVVGAAMGPSAAAVLVAGYEGGTGSPSFARSPRDGSVQLAYHSEQRDVNIRRWEQRRGAGPGPERAVSRDHTLPLRSGSTWWEDSPAVSPDGRQVAFTSNRTGMNEIWSADIDGASARQVTSHGPVVLAPAWSPDGRRLAFTRQVGGDRDIYVIDADGSHSTRLTWEPTQEDNPAWSRDGRSIYFRSDRGGIGQIWKMPAHGGPARRVTTGAGSQAFESPDGQRTYFVRSTDEPGLWAIPVDGGAETLIAPRVREGLWGVADDGIAFVDRTNLRDPAGLPLAFYDFATRATTTRATISIAAEVSSGFAIARDGHSALFVTVDQVQHDLMLIDRWVP